MNLSLFHILAIQPHRISVCNNMTENVWLALQSLLQYVWPATLQTSVCSTMIPHSTSDCFSSSLCHYYSLDRSSSNLFWSRQWVAARTILSTPCQDNLPGPCLTCEVKEEEIRPWLQTPSITKNNARLSSHLFCLILEYHYLYIWTLRSTFWMCTML